MRTKDSLILIAAMSAVSFFWAVGSTVAQDSAEMGIGPYQASAVLKQDGANRLFITVIDTRTGQIVNRWRADPGDYKRPEGDWIFIRPK